MGQTKDLAGVRHHRCNLLLSHTAMGRGDSGKMAQTVARLGAALVESTIGCHLAAFLTCAVAAFCIANYADRNRPFDFIAPYATPSTARAGDTVSITFRLADVRRTCHGDFTRWFTDAKGKRFPLGTFPTVYHEYIKMDPELRTYDKDITIPRNATPGPGVYESAPRFWCNLAQILDPITGESVKVQIMVLPPDVR